MRWEALFSDLEAQLAAADQLSLESEISERVRMEQAVVALADKLRAHQAQKLQVLARGGFRFTGTVTHVGSQWIVLQQDLQSVLLPLGALVSISGLGRAFAAEQAEGVRRLGLASALRALARDRAEVAVIVANQLSGGTSLHGIIDAVGRDFLELASSPRTGTRVSERQIIPFSAVVAISSLDSGELALAQG